MAASARSASAPLNPWPASLSSKSCTSTSAALQTLENPGGLLEGDVGILPAVQQQRRGGLRRDPIQRAGQNVAPPRVLDVAAQEQRQHLGGIDALAIGFREVAGAVVIHDAGDGARLLGVAAIAFELRARRP